MSRRKRIIAVAVPIALVVIGLAARGYVEAAAFVVRAANMQGWVRRAAAFEARQVAQHDTTIPSRHGQLRGRVYVPDAVTGRAILLVPGVHAAGIDEPRLINFAREISATGHPVVTAELPDLARYAITPRTTDMIEDAGEWTRTEWSERVPSGQRLVGLMGISFGGGLSVVAASRMAGRAGWVLSFGGHGDLPRTLRYLCTGNQPDGRQRPPHDYGVVIILLGVANRVVPPEQVAPLQQAIGVFLNASHLDMVDKAKGAAEFARARSVGDSLPEPARTFMGWVNDRDVAHLGPALLPHVSAMGGDVALSPQRNPPPAMPVYLLHGADDNVIPAVESTLLAEDLRKRGGQAVSLATPLITHAEVDHPPGVVEIWRLIRFWAAPL